MFVCCFLKSRKPFIPKRVFVCVRTTKQEYIHAYTRTLDNRINFSHRHTTYQISVCLHLRGRHVDVNISVSLRGGKGFLMGHSIMQTYEYIFICFARAQWLRRVIRHTLYMLTCCIHIYQFTHSHIWMHTYTFLCVHDEPSGRLRLVARLPCSFYTKPTNGTEPNINPLYQDLSRCRTLKPKRGHSYTRPALHHTHTHKQS